MQYSIATAISTVLLASSLTAAAVIPRQTDQAITEASILMKDGNQDESVDRSVKKADFGFLLSASSAGQPFTGLSLRGSTEGVTCGIFDPKTNKLLNGLTFTGNDHPANFGLHGDTGESDGSPADAISVDVCCDLDANFAKTCSNPKPTSATSSNNAGSSPSSAATSTMTAPPSVSTTADSEDASSTSIVFPPIGIDNSDHASTTGIVFPPVGTPVIGNEQASSTAIVFPPVGTPSAGSVDTESTGSDVVTLEFSRDGVDGTTSETIAVGTVQQVVFGNNINKIHISKSHTPLNCQAFLDPEGDQPVGAEFNVEKTGVQFQDFESKQAVDVRGVNCRQIL